MSAFAYGKLPAHGDFVCRGLGASERAAWDGWATGALEAAREALGEGFDEAHEQAPPWRFRFGEGAFGAGWRTGAFAASIDRVGRRFIIVLGVAGAWNDEAAGALEGVLYRALAEGLSVDDTVQAVAGKALDGEAVEQACFWTLGGPRHAAQSLACAAPPEDLLVRAFTLATEAQSP